jgi:hypothetical protein
VLAAADPKESPQVAEFREWPLEECSSAFGPPREP